MQCVAVRCSVLQCVAVRCSVLQCVAGCCSELQGVAVWYNVVTDVASMCVCVCPHACMCVSYIYTHAYSSHGRDYDLFGHVFSVFSPMYVYLIYVCTCVSHICMYVCITDTGYVWSCVFHVFMFVSYIYLRVW